MGQEFVTFAILEQPYVALYNAQPNPRILFSIDMQLSANTAFYFKFQDTFAATLGKQKHSAMIKEPSLAHQYDPMDKPPVKPPPA